LKLYSVITIVPGWPSPETERQGGSRTVAICTSLERAKQIIERNEGDILEGSYGFALVVEFDADHLYGGNLSIGNQHWYQWAGDSEKGKYVPTTPPMEYQRILFSF